MKRRKRLDVGELEAAVLNALWERGPSTVADVVDALPDGQARHYNTCSTVLTRLEARGLVERSRDGRSHVFAPLVSREEFGREYLERVRREVFGGSLGRTIAALLEPGRSDSRDEKRLRKLLEQIEADEEGGGDGR